MSDNGRASKAPQRDEKTALEEVRKCDLQNLHYMKAVIKETMRLHPPVPLLVPHESMEKCVLDGYEIPAKSRVLINGLWNSRDPKLRNNPLKYNPERFMDNDTDFKDQDYRILPFGGGRTRLPRFCLRSSDNRDRTGLAFILHLLGFYIGLALPHRVGADEVDLDEIFALIFVSLVGKDYEFREDKHMENVG
uniref:Cytochrome P450 n=1 Tax=Salix viminalis TaxID=40686 RepID=A0A6N2N9B7_SALVM